MRGAGEPVTWAGVSKWLPDGATVARTILIPLGIAAIATLLALPTAWAMRRLPSWWLALVIAPLLLPNYTIYAALSGARGAGTPMGDAIINGPPGAFATANLVQAVLSLALWAWPIAALVLVPAARGIDQDLVDAARGAGIGAIRRGLLLARLMRNALVFAVLVIALLMLGSAVPLHVAQVETWAIELWRGLFETGGRSPAVWVAALPLVALLAAGGCGIAWAASRARPEVAIGAGRPVTAPVWVCILALSVWALTFLGPLVLLVLQLRSLGSLPHHWHDVAPPLVASGRVSLVTGGIAMVLALGAASAVGAIARRALALVAVALVGVALVPGVFVGHAFVAAGDTEALLWLNRTPSGLVGSHVIRLGAVAVALGWWCSRREPGELVDWRRLVAGERAWAWMTSWGRGQVGVLLGAGLAVAILSLHEIEASAIAAPAGPRLLPQYMLDLLHYLRDEELKVATILLVAGGGTLAIITSLLLSAAPRVRLGRATRTLSIAALCVMVVGCGDKGPTDAAPFKPDHIIGGIGREDGLFLRPRAIDAHDGRLWIVDKSARIQRFDADGAHEATWSMPEFDTGMPVGLTLGADGLIYVADTHEQRVVVYRSTEEGGEVVATFGTYGAGDGQFVYPTDVAVEVGPDGVTTQRIYVSEYGGNDRISVFDADYQFLFSFGREGFGQDPTAIEFERPQSLLFHPDNGDLYVTDSVNHRIGRFTTDGTLVGWFGRPGPEPGSELGEFRYPYGIAALPDGDLLVCEMGNNRVQRIDPITGEGLAVFGVPGREEGTLQTPWGVATIGWDVYILDTGNHRVQVIELGDGGLLRGW